MTILSFIETFLAAAFIGTQTYMVFKRTNEMKPLKQKVKVDPRRKA